VRHGERARGSLQGPVMQPRMRKVLPAALQDAVTGGATLCEPARNCGIVPRIGRGGGMERACIMGVAAALGGCATAIITHAPEARKLAP